MYLERFGQMKLGSLVVGFGSGVTDFFASWVFNKDVNLATNEALQLCNDHITGILRSYCRM